MRRGWPDDQGLQRPTVCAFALYRSHHRPLETRASVVLQVVLTNQDFDRAELAQRAYLVYAVHVYS
jgi:hypothetical protein